MVPRRITLFRTVAVGSLKQSAARLIGGEDAILPHRPMTLKGYVLCRAAQAGHATAQGRACVPCPTAPVRPRAGQARCKMGEEGSTMNTEFEKRVIIGSLCLILLLALSLFVILYPAPACSRPSPGLHQGLGYKPHPQNSGFHGMAVSESRSQPEPGRASRSIAASEKEFIPGGSQG